MNFAATSSTSETNPSQNEGSPLRISEKGEDSDEMIAGASSAISRGSAGGAKIGKRDAHQREDNTTSVSEILSLQSNEAGGIGLAENLEKQWLPEPDSMKFYDTNLKMKAPKACFVPHF